MVSSAAARLFSDRLYIRLLAGQADGLRYFRISGKLYTYIARRGIPQLGEQLKQRLIIKARRDRSTYSRARE